MPPKKTQSKAAKTGSRTAAEAAVEAPRTGILCCQKIVEVKEEVLYCKGKSESVMDPFTASALASQSCIMNPFVLQLRRKVLKQTLSSPFYA